MAQISRYRLYIHGKRKSNEPIAQINLYTETGRKAMGRVYFYRDSKVIPSSSEGRMIVLSMHENQLNTVIDMLRNEKPCYIAFNNSSSAYLSTDTEPIGEEES